MKLLLVNDEGDHLGELEMDGNTATLKKLKPELKASVVDAYDEDDHDEEKDGYDDEDEGIEPDDMERSMAKGGELNEVFKGKKSPSDVRAEKESSSDEGDDEEEDDGEESGYTPVKQGGPMKAKRAGLF